MSDRVRWYNRAAAWLYGLIGEPLLTLATPVWADEAEQEALEAEAREAAATEAAYREGCEAGYRQGINDATELPF